MTDLDADHRDAVGDDGAGRLFGGHADTARTPGGATCEECIGFLMDYLDGLLPVAQRDVFDRHLARCPDCVAYIASYRAAVELASRAGGRGAGGLGAGGLSTSGSGMSEQPLAEPLPPKMVEAILRARKGGG